MDFLKKLQTFFLIILSLDYSLRKPLKKKILLFDDNLESFLKKYFKNQYSILHSRYRNYNLIIFLKSIIKNNFKFSHLNYFNEYVKYVNPKILITFTDNNSIFWKIQNCAKITKIFIQNGNRTNTSEDIFSYSVFLKKKKMENKVDFMLVFNRKVGEIYESFICGKHKVIGSFRSNSFEIIKKKKIDIFFISTWRDHNSDLLITPTITFGEFVKTHIVLIKYIQNFVVKNNRHITIYGKYNTPKEKKFFKDILGDKNWTFLENDRKKSYHYIDQSELVISTISSMGIETLGRDSKLAIFDVCKFNKSTQSKSFGWPYKIKKEGPFWTSKLSQSSCDKLLTKVSHYKKAHWKNLKKKHVNKFMIYDKNNKKFTSLVKNLLKN